MKNSKKKIILKIPNCNIVRMIAKNKASLYEQYGTIISIKEQHIFFFSFSKKIEPESGASEKIVL